MTNWDKVKETWELSEFITNKATYVCDKIKELQGTNPKCKFYTCKKCYKWLKQEYKEPILDEAEKKYLGNIVRPFRDKIDGIKKECGRTTENIKILTKEDMPLHIVLPPFTIGTMYKGMRIEKIYTLKELGI